MAALLSWPTTARSFAGSATKPIGTSSAWNPAWQSAVGQMPAETIQNKLTPWVNWTNEQSKQQAYNAANQGNPFSWDRWVRMIGLGYGPQLGYTGQRTLQSGSPIGPDWMAQLRQMGTTTPSTTSTPKVAAGLTLPSWWNIRNQIVR